jgi:hypothetical protein
MPWFLVLDSFLFPVLDLRPLSSGTGSLFRSLYSSYSFSITFDFEYLNAVRC